ncbi:uncharacterized protein MELLADRAFT_111388 [Melampsora larici-populina 98AG31]|uniref:Uncharacterized protein n=1 Tax=Melampsora larici-populina (strain 98AG31 / pathotype 3-4-7) TaxID=747676 RepID=F4S315_MELLP|nr:uncharacterized protein MELLADRAFT_111388 [Melampsora larici-populina 98AG31]EGG00898.1 hypothetical protein MELLADRAFT_111388 [Melampsora larici-populina 98AG31]
MQLLSWFYQRLELARASLPEALRVTLIHKSFNFSTQQDNRVHIFLAQLKVMCSILFAPKGSNYSKLVHQDQNMVAPSSAHKLPAQLAQLMATCSICSQKSKQIHLFQMPPFLPRHIFATELSDQGINSRWSMYYQIVSSTSEILWMHRKDDINSISRCTVLGVLLIN